MIGEKVILGDSWSLQTFEGLITKQLSHLIIHIYNLFRKNAVNESFASSNLYRPCYENMIYCWLDKYTNKQKKNIKTIKLNTKQFKFYTNQVVYEIYKDDGLWIDIMLS